MKWYFDFISPYAYLQSARLEKLSDIAPVQCIPVLFAGLLKHWGQLGPAEIAPKRDFTFKHVSWLAHRDGIELTLPPSHPFNPLPLLRLSQLLGNTPAVVQRLFRFVWAEGNIPQDKKAFDALLDELGVTPDQLASQQIKTALLDNGEQALTDGIFGVPAVCWKGEVFWGYEATGMVEDFAAAAAAVDQSDRWPQQAMQRAMAMPNGQSRQQHSAQKAQADYPAPDSGTRIPMLPADLAEPADLVKHVRQRRGGELLELDRLLLYSPALAEGWNHFLGNVRTRLQVSAKLRELVMCIVAVVNGAEYEFHHHAPLWREEGGTDEQIAAARDPEKALASTDLFDPLERAAIGLALQMTRDIKVANEHFDVCLEHLGEQQLVELIATAGAYNMVSRFLVALNLQPAH